MQFTETRNVQGPVKRTQSQSQTKHKAKDIYVGKKKPTNVSRQEANGILPLLNNLQTKGETGNRVPCMYLYVIPKYMMLFIHVKANKNLRESEKGGP